MKKYYKEIAKIISGCTKARDRDTIIKAELIKDLSDYFTSTDSKFNEIGFVKACYDIESLLKTR